MLPRGQESVQLARILAEVFVGPQADIGSDPKGAEGLLVHEDLVSDSRGLDDRGITVFLRNRAAYRDDHTPRSSFQTSVASILYLLDADPKRLTVVRHLPTFRVRRPSRRERIRQHAGLERLPVLVE